MNKVAASLLMTAALTSGCAIAQGSLGLVSERSISTTAALELATAALERCRADGYKRKAYTAFTTRSPSAEMAKRTQPGLAGFMQLKKITTIEGGLPIFAGKELVGSVGISGAPGGEKDAACAQAGIDKITKSLGS
jgi:hypothetical protein